MKKNTIITIAAAAAAALAVLLLLFPLLSRLVFGRSQAATLFMAQLGKSPYTTEERFQDYLSEMREENLAPYTIPEEVEITADITEESIAGVQFFSMNRDLNQERTVFYFPGGSYISQPSVTHWEFLDRLAADLGCAVIVPIYPKLPDNDAETSYAVMEAAYAEYLADNDRGEIVFMGDSAGGGYALSFAMQLRDAGLPGPDKLILICPWVDVALTNPEIAVYEKKDPTLDSAQLRHLGELWAGELDPEAPVVSPLYGSHTGLGTITLFTGTCELLYPDIMLLSDKLAEEGVGHHLVRMDGMFHVWPLYIAYSIPESAEAYELILQDVLN